MKDRVWCLSLALRSASLRLGVGSRDRDPTMVMLMAKPSSRGLRDWQKTAMDGDMGEVRDLCAGAKANTHPH